MYEEWTDTLQSSPLNHNIDWKTLNIMLDCLKPRIKKYKQREIIVTSGQTFQGVGIIASGMVSLVKETYTATASSWAFSMPEIYLVKNGRLFQ
jgi:signal-transduction protein with cAMP-binding, CBS, and nucleotidyltransferase domain